MAAIRAHAASDPHREVCGLLFGTADHIIGVSAAANVAETPERHFEIDPATLFKAIRKERADGPKMAGYYHSHPFGPPFPSMTDRESAAPDGKLWIIVAGEAIGAWHATSQGFEPVELVIDPLPPESVSATRPS